MNTENMEYITVAQLIDSITDQITEDHCLIPCDWTADCPQDVKDSEDIMSFYHECTSWFGIKHIDSPFDSDDKLYMVDAYGGGAAQLIEIFSGQEKEEVHRAIRQAILDSAQINGYGLRTSEKILVEWLD